MGEIPLPHDGWLPRDHQVKLWRYLHEGGRRAVAIWHRRAGKDEVALHHTAVAMAQRPGNYVHCLPLYAHGRKSVWTAINSHSGKRRIDEVFPPALRTGYSEQEMFLRMAQSTWQVIGSDTYDSSLVGTSVAGIVFSEYSLSNPSAWAYCRPILEENDGWALFITTPRGRNHAHDMYKLAQTTPGWFAELLTAEDTGALSRAQLDEALAEYTALYGRDLGTAQYRQEYLCDFQASVLGSFFALEMSDVRSEGRVVAVEPPAGVAIHRAWDIGVTDDTSIWWFCQVGGGQLWILDHFAASGVGVEYYRDIILEVERERGWTHGIDYVPHDAKVKEWGSGRTRVETMQQLGLRPMLVPMASIQDGLNAVRRTLPLCVFHPRCETTGLLALEQHRREWDDEKKAFKASAVHDWTSHAVDAFRYLSLAWKPLPPRVAKEPTMEGWRIPPPVEPRRGGIQL